MDAPAGRITLDELRADIGSGAVDTVAVAFTDMQGRLQGKRLHAHHFMNEVLEHGTEGCNYLLAVDVDMNTVDGYAMSSWDTGYGDFMFVPDLATLSRVPWNPGTVAAARRPGLGGRDPGDALAAPGAQAPDASGLPSVGLVALAGTELEFIVFRDRYDDAWQKAYRGMTPANLYNVDYSMLGTARIEPLLRRIRNEMTGAGMTVESAKGECNLGQHEIAFRFDDVVRTCDNHSVYKTGAKEIADQEGMSLTFMAKYDEKEGNSCHIHLSFRGTDGGLVFADGHGMSTLARQYTAGQIAAMRELTLFFAPNINSYKRFVEGSFAPTAMKWGFDNRTCALRVVGHGPSLRVENRVPGGDVNPYLGCAALIAAGLHGIENELELEDAFEGNAYASDAEHVPETLAEALALWEGSEIARAAFGEDVVAHYANMARVELAAYNSAVTDWERFRSFERM